MTSQTKQLRFSTEKPKVQRIDFISDDDCKNVWFCAEDYAQIRTNNSKTTKKFRNDLQSNPDLDPLTLPYCVRGLEHTVGKGYTDRRKRILQAVCLVLYDQRDALFDLDGDAFSSAEKYAQATVTDRELAASRGLHDEEAAAIIDLMDEAGLSEEEQRAALSQSFWASTDEKPVVEVQDEKKPSSLRAKRRRSSERKIKGFGVSLKNFARKMTSPSAA